MVDRHRGIPHRLAQSLPVGLRLDVAHPVPQLGGPVAHRREDQVRLGTMEAPPAEDTPGLDHQERRLPVRATPRRVDEMRAELIAEQPVGRAGFFLGHAERSLDGLMPDR